MIPLLALLAAAGLVAAAYAHQRLPRYTAGRARIALTRGVLAAVGIAVGFTAARYAVEPPVVVLAFLIGFGAVHVPAAFILLVKRARGAART